MRFTKIIVIIIAIIAISSCSKDAVTEPEQIPDKTDLLSIALASRGLEFDEDISAILYHQHMLFYISEVSKNITFTDVDADFYNDSYNYTIGAGLVTINGDTLVSEIIPDNGDPLVCYSNPDMPVDLDGRIYNWIVEGSTLHAGFTTSINSLSYEMTVATPAINSTVNKTNGFTITWDNGSTPSDGVDVIISQAGGPSSQTVCFSDTGSCVITPEMLNGFTVGTDIGINVIAYNYVIEPVGSKNAIIYVCSGHEIPLMLGN